ncbi:DUF674 family protein [Trifolium medium]|uniref:DUF674 family protein n=1 Tax=Trifolium medium TaxID=97028 RepID=A0A392Q3C5_9FABA|nr:DUF674 family protein [Trifolium medium]
MLLCPRNPCESLCKNLFLNIDETAESLTPFYVCNSCDTFTNFQNLNCTCGKPLKRTPLDSEVQGNNAQNAAFHRKGLNRKPRNLDSKGQGTNAQNGVFIRGSGPMFVVSNDLKILPSSTASSLMMLVELGCSDIIHLEEVTHNIGKQEDLKPL